MLETLHFVLYYFHMANELKKEGYLYENYRVFHLSDTAGQERDFHFHGFDKIVVLISGRVDYGVEDTVYNMRPGDILLIKHHAIHKALIDLSIPYERYIVYLQPGFPDRNATGIRLSSCFDRADEWRNCLIVPDNNSFKDVVAVLDELHSISADGQFGAEVLRDSLLFKLMVLLNRLQSKGSSGEKKHSTGSKLEEVLSYINSHPGESPAVDDLAEMAHLSRYHFMRLFKEETGESVHAYVRQRKLLNAARLIREGMKTMEAAELNGFQDYSVFYRAFKETFGTAPGQLK